MSLEITLKQENFYVVKEKIIKTNELLLLFKEKNDKLAKASQAFKNLKAKFESINLEKSKLTCDNERLNFTVDSIKSQYTTNEKELGQLKIDFNRLNEKYQETVIDSQLTIAKLEESQKSCKCGKENSLPAKSHSAKLKELNKNCKGLIERQKVLESQNIVLIANNEKLKNINKLLENIVEELNMKNNHLGNENIFLKTKVEKVESEKRFYFKDAINFIDDRLRNKVMEKYKEQSYIKYELLYSELDSLIEHIKKKNWLKKIDFGMQTEPIKPLKGENIKSDNILKQDVAVKVDMGDIQSEDDDLSDDNIRNILEQMSLPKMLSPCQEPFYYCPLSPVESLPKCLLFDKKESGQIPSIIITPPTPYLENISEKDFEKLNILSADPSSKVAVQSQLNEELSQEIIEPDKNPNSVQDVVKSSHIISESNMLTIKKIQSETTVTIENCLEEKKVGETDKHSIEKNENPQTKKNPGPVYNTHCVNIKSLLENPEQTETNYITESPKLHKNVTKSKNRLNGPISINMKEGMSKVRKCWWPTTTNIFIPTRNKRKKSKQRKRVLVDNKPKDTILTALLQLQANNIGFTISNESLPKLENGGDLLSSLVSKVPHKNITSPFSEEMCCKNPNCLKQNNRMLLQNVPGEMEPQLLGFFSDDSDFFNKKASEKPKNENSEYLLELLLKGIKKIVHGKEKHASECRKRRSVVTSETSSFLSETEPEIERLFRNSSNILERNKGLLAAAKQRHINSTGDSIFESESDIMVDSGLVTATPKLDTDSLSYCSLNNPEDSIDFCDTIGVYKGFGQKIKPNVLDKTALKIDVPSMISPLASSKGSPEKVNLSYKSVNSAKNHEDYYMIRHDGDDLKLNYSIETSDLNYSLKDIHISQFESSIDENHLLIENTPAKKFDLINGTHSPLTNNSLNEVSIISENHNDSLTFPLNANSRKRPHELDKICEVTQKKIDDLLQSKRERLTKLKRVVEDNVSDGCEMVSGEKSNRYDIDDTLDTNTCTARNNLNISGIELKGEIKQCGKEVKLNLEKKNLNISLFGEDSSESDDNECKVKGDENCLNKRRSTRKNAPTLKKKLLTKFKTLPYFQNNYTKEIFSKESTKEPATPKKVNKSEDKVKIIQHLVLHPNVESVPTSTPLVLNNLSEKKSHIPRLPRKINKKIDKNKNTPVDILSTVMKEMTKCTPKSNVTSIQVINSVINSPLPLQEDKWDKKLNIECRGEDINSCDMSSCPKSPDFIEISDQMPRLIPTEKPTKLQPTEVKVVMEKLMIYSNEENILEEIVNSFAFQDVDYIVQIVLSKLFLDYHDKAEDLFPPSPIMTQTQRILLGFLAKLEKASHPGLFNHFLSCAEQELFNKRTSIPVRIQPITRLYTAICKLRKDINRMRRFVCEGFYFMGDLAVPMLFTVLTMWAEVLPMASELSDHITAKVLVQLCYLKTCNQPGYNLVPLRDLLNKYFGYPIERWNCEEVYQDVLIEYIRNPSRRLSDYTLLLFLKNKPSSWVHQKMKSTLIPLYNQVPDTNVNLKATLVILLAHICAGFCRTEDKNWDIILEIKQWMETISTDSLHPVIKRSVMYSQSILPRSAVRKRKPNNPKEDKTK